MFQIPLMIFEAFSMLAIAAQTAALDPLMATCTSTIMVFLPGSSDGPWPMGNTGRRYRR